MHLLAILHVWSPIYFPNCVSVARLGSSTYPRMKRISPSGLQPPPGWKSARLLRPAARVSGLPHPARLERVVTSAIPTRVSIPQGEVDFPADQSESDATTEEVPPGISGKRQETLRRRAHARRKMLAAVEQYTSGKSALEKWAVTEQTRAIYSKEVASWMKWLDDRGEKPTADAEVDEALVTYMVSLFAAGHQASRWERLLAGFIYLAPEWGKLGSRKFLAAGWLSRAGARSVRPEAGDLSLSGPGAR